MSKPKGPISRAAKRICAYMAAAVLACVALLCTLAMASGSWVFVPDDGQVLDAQGPGSVGQSGNVGQLLGSEVQAADRQQESVANDGVSQSGQNYVRTSNGTVCERDHVLIVIEEDMDLACVNATLRDCATVHTKRITEQDFARGYADVELASGADVEEAIRELGQRGVSAQPNYIYSVASGALSAQSSVNDPLASNQWALDSIGAYKAWDLARAQDARVSVAVLDTGCQIAHEDLKDNVKAIYNSYSGSTSPDQVVDKTSNGHGTHVAGIISARAGNGKGVAGVSYNAGLVIIKATTSESNFDFTTKTLADAYDWLLNQKAASGKTNAQEHNVRVINMSIGECVGDANQDGRNDAKDVTAYVSKNTVLYRMIDKAYEQGILTVCAAGNSASGPLPYCVCPGDYEKCLAVINLQRGSGAVNDAGGKYHVERSPDSNYNYYGTTAQSTYMKQISAPGTRILSANTKSRTDTANGYFGDYSMGDGTSFSAPVAAGVAALVFARNPALSAQGAMNVITASATDIEMAGFDLETGYGEVNAYGAVQLAKAQLNIAKSLGPGQSASPGITLSDGSAASLSDWECSSSNQSILSVDEDTGTTRALRAGSARVIATHKRVKDLTLSATVTVPPVSLAGAKISPVESFYFTGTEIKPDITVSLGGKELVRGTDYVVLYTNNARVGTATIIVKGINDYTGRVAKSFKIKKPKIAFSDVNHLTPHVQDILWLSDKGISTGWKTGKNSYRFRGTDTVVRQDMAAFLHRLGKLSGLSENIGGKGVSFADVNKKTPHASDIRWLAKAGISQGWVEGGKRYFKGVDNVTRQDMAAFMRRLADLADDKKLNNSTRMGPIKLNFADVTSKTPHAQDIKWMASHGISTGWEAKGRHYFKGTSSVTRQDTAAFMHRLITSGAMR